MADRFQFVSKDYVEQRIKGRILKNTQKNTNWVLIHGIVGFLLEIVQGSWGKPNFQGFPILLPC